MTVAYLSRDTIKELEGLGDEVQLDATRALRALSPLHAEYPSWEGEVAGTEPAGYRPDLLAPEVPGWATDLEWLSWKRRWRVPGGDVLPRRTDLSYKPSARDDCDLSGPLAENIAPKFARDEAWSRWLQSARRKLEVENQRMAVRGNKGRPLRADEERMRSSSLHGGPQTLSQEMEHMTKVFPEFLGEASEGRKERSLSVAQGGGASAFHPKRER